MTDQVRARPVPAATASVAGTARRVYLVGIYVLVLAVVGRLGRIPGRTLWLTASVAGLVIVQSLLLAPQHMDATGVVRAVSALHVVNALLIFWVVLRLRGRTSDYRH